MKQIRLACYSFITLALTSCATGGGNYHQVADANGFPADTNIAYNHQNRADGILKIVTLNVAHGRNQSVSQLLLDKEDISANLLRIAGVLGTVGADVVALQEADGPSGWSGKFKRRSG